MSSGWVFGGPWTYDAEPRGKPTGEDAAWLAEQSQYATFIHYRVKGNSDR